MKGRGKIRASWTELLPTICLAAIWPAVWLLWPHGDATSSQASPDPDRDAAVTSGVSRIRYVLRRTEGEDSTWSPTLIALPSRTGFSGALRDESRSGGTFRPVRKDSAKLLQRSDSSVAASAEAFAGSAVRGSVPTVAFRPAATESPVFAPAAREPVTGVLVELSPALRDRGFAIGALSTNGIPGTDKAWIVKAYVQVDRKGEISLSFIEEPCPDAGVNAAVMRALRAGTASIPGDACEGLVTVSRPHVP